MIRQLKTHDIGQVADIWLRASTDQYSFVAEHTGLSPRDFWIARLPDVIQTTLTADGYVSEVRDQIQGFITMRPETSCGYYICELFVASTWRRRGIGEALIKHAKSLGAYLRVSAYQRADWAVRFYEKHGFVAHEPRVEEGTQQHKIDLLWQSR